MCDQISDAILDAILRKDRTARVACETATTTGTVFVLGEITTTAYVDFQEVIRETVRGIGYTDASYRLRLPNVRDHRLGPRAVARHQPGRQRAPRRRAAQIDATTRAPATRE